MRRRIVVLMLTVLMLLSCSVAASATNVHNRKTGTIGLTVVEPTEDLPITGAVFEVYHVASAVVNSNLRLSLAYTGAFKNCKVSYYADDLAAKLDEYLPENTAADAVLVTDDEGKAVSGELPLGMYLVKQVATVEGLRLCAPFVVTIPVINGTDIVYAVDASPKTEFVWLTDIHIKKVWSADKTSSIPTSVTVQLLHGEDVVETATLNKANNWQVTYENMPTSDSYSVKEINVPKGFTATYKQNGYEFVVTNTASLAQTGQLIWPIPIFAILGIAFLMAGFVILRKSRSDNA